MTLEATIGALLYDIEKPTPLGGEDACLAMRFARRLVSGDSWDSQGMPSKPLESIFTHLNGEHSKQYLPMTLQDGRKTGQTSNCRGIPYNGVTVDCPISGTITHF